MNFKSGLGLVESGNLAELIMHQINTKQVLLSSSEGVGSFQRATTEM